MSCVPLFNVVVSECLTIALTIKLPALSWLFFIVSCWLELVSYRVMCPLSIIVWEHSILDASPRERYYLFLVHGNVAWEREREREDLGFGDLVIFNWQFHCCCQYLKHWISWAMSFTCEWGVQEYQHLWLLISTDDVWWIHKVDSLGKLS